MTALPLRALAIAGALLSGSLQADPVRYTIDPTHTFPAFEISHLGYSKHRGRFNATAGSVLLDREQKSGTIEVVIDAASIDTGQEALEKVLRSDGFFNVTQFPTLHFRSTGLTFDGEKLLAVDGELTLLGQTRPLRLHIDHFHCGLQVLTGRNVCGANATTVLRRSEFGMSKFLNFGLGDEVKLTIQVEAIADRAEPVPIN